MSTAIAEPAERPVLLPRAELYLCLARVFSPQGGQLSREQVDSELLPDFQALGSELSAITDQWLQSFSQALAASSAAGQMARDYTRLFLMPPAPAPLNLGYCLDGHLMGHTSQLLAAYQARYGLARQSGFHDLPDHLSLNLQWLAWVLAGLREPPGEWEPSPECHPVADAHDVVSAYLLPGVRALIERVDASVAEKGTGGVWLALLQLAEAQLREDSEWLKAEVKAQRPAGTPQQQSPAQKPETEPAGEALSLICRRCGQSFVADEALSMMIPRLREAGLATDHMERCPDCQGNTQGPSLMTPPEAR